MDKFLIEEFDKPVNKKLIEYMFKIGERKESITPKAIHEFIRINTRAREIYYFENGDIKYENYGDVASDFYSGREDGPSRITYFRSGIVESEEYHNPVDKSSNVYNESVFVKHIIYFKDGTIETQE